MNENSTPENEDEQDNNKNSQEDSPNVSDLEKIKTPDSEPIIPEEVKPILQKLPEHEQRTVKALVALSIKKLWSGPLPPPDILREYNEVIPNGAERIFKRSEKQSDHRMQLENLAVSTELKQSSRGQHYGLIIAFSFLIAAFVLAYTGHDTAGIILGTVDIFGLVSIFVLGKYNQKEDLNKKTQSPDKT